MSFPQEFSELLRFSPWKSFLPFDFQLSLILIIPYLITIPVNMSSSTFASAARAAARSVVTRSVYNDTRNNLMIKRNTKVIVQVSALSVIRARQKKNEILKKILNLIVKNRDSAKFESWHFSRVTPVAKEPSTASRCWSTAPNSSEEFRRTRPARRIWAFQFSDPSPRPKTRLAATPPSSTSRLLEPPVPSMRPLMPRLDSLWRLLRESHSRTWSESRIVCWSRVSRLGIQSTHSYLFSRQIPSSRPQLPGNHCLWRVQNRHHARPHPQEGLHRNRVAIGNPDLWSRPPDHRRRAGTDSLHRNRRRSVQRNQLYRLSRGVFGWWSYQGWGFSFILWRI